MGKLPAFQFYPSDWSRDMEAHPLEIRGAWITILCKLFWSETRGTANFSSTQWARVLDVGERKCLSIINCLAETKIADVLIQNGSITISSRRMLHDEKTRKIRSEAGSHGGNPNFKEGKSNPYYDNQKDNQKITKRDNQKITPSIFNIQSSYSIQAEEASGLPFFKNNNGNEKARQEIAELSVKLNESIFKGGVFKWVGKAIKDHKHPEAILQALRRCYNEKPKNPWAYCQKIIDVESGNYFEKEAIRISDTFKKGKEGLK